MSSFARDVLLPPAYSEQPTTAEWRHLSRVRLVLAVLAVLIDVGLYLGLRNQPSIDRDVLVRFALINIPLLLLSVGVSLAMLRLPSARRVWLLATIAALEALTIVVWTQATGSLTSYFMLVGALTIVGYRLYSSYQVGAAVTLVLVCCHGAAVVLEATGVLRPEPLFLGEPSRIYGISSYQLLAATSIAWAYLLVFIAGNAFVNKLRAKDRALAEVQREAARAAEGLRHGRLTGTLLSDEYALGELLGRGGMGEIYSARTISDERLVAVKVLHGNLIEDDGVLERFRREAEVAARVPAEHTARVLGIGVDTAQHLHFIAMELLRGEDLAAYLRRRGTLTPAELMPIVRGIGVALDAAHAAGVVHRDLKPQNVFLLATADSELPAIRLLDFGVSKLLDDARSKLTQTHAVIGTIGYLAPEQALGRNAEIDGAADRFALGAIVYRSLTGHLPFEATDLVEAIQQVVNDRPAPVSSWRPELPRDVDAVLAISLAKEPRDRFATAAAMVSALERAFRGELGPKVWGRAMKLDPSLGDDPTLAATPVPV
ncbi:MAG TPA: serine/threonine-protein kinase [Kofleriaceae bacterium]|nr:serine/threonine-protein kinase [Kofleriaceae bacterium]